MKRRIGIFGGTFDPPHLGHLILAGEAIHDLQLDHLFWLLTPNPPHKTERSITSWQVRLEMLALCLGGDPVFAISRVDVDRPAPHYAVDSMHILASQNPGAELVYIMGGDSLMSLPTWHNPEEFLLACHTLGIMRRPGDQIDLGSLEAILPGLKSKVQFMDAPLLDISSHQIRQRIQAADTYRYYLPPRVYAYIEEHRLYR